MKKKLLFKNSTQYSKKLYDEFTQFHNKKNSRYYDLFTVFILILIVYCIYSTLKAKVFPLSIIFLAIFILFAGYRVFYPFFFYKKEITKKSITKEKTFNFYFYNTYFKVKNNSNFDKIPYFKLYRVYETEKYFYLYLLKNYSFIIDKNGFNQGTSKEFSNFIKNKMWIRYSKSIKENSAK